MQKKYLLTYFLTLFLVISSSSLSSLASEVKYGKLIVPGQDIPLFNIVPIDKSPILTKENLIGKIYLIDFWRTTCKKCVDKMAFLHEMHNEFGAQGLLIISISLDQSHNEVKSFRSGPWKMPWHHSVLENGFENELAETFEVEHLPTMILVGRFGKILWTNENSDDGELKRILFEIFKKG